MVYSYFPTRKSAQKWADENLSLRVGQRYVIGLKGDYYYLHYPLRAIK